MCSVLASSIGYFLLSVYGHQYSLALKIDRRAMLSHRAKQMEVVIEFPELDHYQNSTILVSGYVLFPIHV